MAVQAKTMERDADEKPTLQEEEFLSGRSLLVAAGFSCFLALQTYCGLSIALPLALGHTQEYAVVLRIVSILAVIVVYVVGDVKADWVASHYASVLVPAVALGIVPFVAKAAALSFGFGLGMAALVTWAMLGVSFAASGFLWCLIMSQNSLRQNVLTVAFSAFFSVMIYVATCAAEPKQLGLVGMAIVIVAELAIFNQLVKGVPWDGPVAEDDDGSFRETGPEMFWTACHSAVSIMAKHWSLNRLLASRQVQQLSLPFVVATLLLIPSCNEAGLVVCAGLNTSLNAFSMVLKWCEASEMNQEFRLHAIRRYAKTGIPTWLGMLVGTVLGWYVFMRQPSLGDGEHLVLVGLSFLLLLSFALFSLGETRRFDFASLGAGGVVPAGRGSDGFFVQSCKKVALEHGLTPRETEVFILLAKGRNAEFIEKELVVSHSTARSHIYNIYKKLGISSHQVLINMVEDRKRK